MRKIVVPGELVTEERKRLGRNVYLRDGKIFSEVIGLAVEDETTASVVALEGRYMPEKGDIVVGIVVGEKFAGYDIDLKYFYKAFVSKKEFMDSLKNHSVVSARVDKVNEVNEIELSNVRVFYGGIVIGVSPVKVPRIIGKDSSMLEVLKKGTNSTLVVGKNGLIWAKTDNLALLEKALEKIQMESHLENLTNRISEFLDKNKKEAK